jgi:hypothetical protein
MAEAITLVGLVASVLQLVDTVAQTHRYINDVRGAPNDQQRLLLEVLNLQPLVRELDRRMTSTQAAGLINGMQEFAEPLTQMKGTMEQLSIKLTPEGFSKVSNRLAWPLWRKKGVEEELSTIERFKGLLNVWLGMDIWSGTSSFTRIVVSLALGIPREAGPPQTRGLQH